MDYRARRRKPFHYPLPLSPPDCQNPQADRQRMPGRALPPFRKRHHPLRFYFFRRKTGRRSPICRRPYRNLPPGSQKNMRNKINRNDMELGYTPYNLRTLRNRCKLTQAELAQIVGVKHYIQVGRWEAKPDTETRRTDMSLEKWRQFLDWTEKQTPSETFRVRSLPAGYGIFYPPPNLKTTTKPHAACPRPAAAPK